MRKRKKVEPMMARVEKLRELMKENNLQGFLVTSPYNLRYLTNFTGTTGLAMITLDKAFCNGFSLYGTSCGTSNWFYYR